HVDDLVDECRAELTEVELERAVEMRRVRLLARQRRFAIDDETVGAEEIGEQRREVLYRRVQVVGLLRTRHRGDGEHAHGHGHTFSHEWSPQKEAKGKGLMAKSSRRAVRGRFR